MLAQQSHCSRNTCWMSLMTDRQPDDIINILRGCLHITCGKDFSRRMTRRDGPVSVAASRLGCEAAEQPPVCAVTMGIYRLQYRLYRQKHLICKIERILKRVRIAPSPSDLLVFFDWFKTVRRSLWVKTIQVRPCHHHCLSFQCIYYTI